MVSFCGCCCPLYEGRPGGGEFAGAILCRMSAEERHPVEVEGGVRRAECRAGMG